MLQLSVFAAFTPFSFIFAAPVLSAISLISFRARQIDCRFHWPFHVISLADIINSH